MGPKTVRLIALLEQAVFLLGEYGDNHHGNQVERCKALLEQSDFRGISNVLGVFNGKNSIYDIEWRSGGSDSESISIGERFEVLSNTIYDLAEDIRREVERGER